MKKYLAMFAIGMISYWVIGGLFLYFTGNSPAEHIALFIEKILG